LLRWEAANLAIAWRAVFLNVVETLECLAVLAAENRSF
jgi:hypothetical protein